MIRDNQPVLGNKSTEIYDTENFVPSSFIPQQASTDEQIINL
jgi:hypothetical protein